MATFFFFFFFFFFFVSGLKLDEKSIENGLEGQKFLVVCLFWGGCHHPNRGTGCTLRSAKLRKDGNVVFRFYLVIDGKSTTTNLFDGGSKSRVLGNKKVVLSDDILRVR